MTGINVKRVYDDPDGHDGYRVLVDRLWPRGESKAKFHYDLWAKDIAPTTELREFLHADPDANWDEFSRRYTSWLQSSPAADELVNALKGRPEVTLLYGSRDRERNNAVVLARYLASMLDGGQ